MSEWYLVTPMTSLCPYPPNTRSIPNRTMNGLSICGTTGFIMMVRSGLSASSSRAGFWNR